MLLKLREGQERSNGRGCQTGRRWSCHPFLAHKGSCHLLKEKVRCVYNISTCISNEISGLVRCPRFQRNGINSPSIPGLRHFCTIRKGSACTTMFDVFGLAVCRRFSKFIAPCPSRKWSRAGSFPLCGFCFFGGLLCCVCCYCWCCCCCGCCCG